MPTAIGHIQESFAEGIYRLTDHALQRMIERGVRSEELEQAFGGDKPEIVEDYPDDLRGPSCLILGWTEANRPLHIQVGYMGDKLDVITVYPPDATEWIAFRNRRK